MDISLPRKSNTQKSDFAMKIGTYPPAYFELPNELLVGNPDKNHHASMLANLSRPDEKTSGEDGLVQVV
jgi:hypothetical protein